MLRRIYLAAHFSSVLFQIFLYNDIWNIMSKSVPLVIPMKFSFYTLGCKVNQYETQAMEQLLREQGHEICRFDEVCDGYIINTCSVTAVADKKNRAVIRRCRKLHPDALIGVCGCYSQHAAEDVQKLEVDIISGSADREAFLNMMLSALHDRQQKTAAGGTKPRSARRDGV
jgi:threonylcarbamoyladenosine tRNA methylthiotransferase MtaB